jgi:phosphoglycerol transferase MdoB-like AlkP superfamily enzyme
VKINEDSILAKYLLFIKRTIFALLILELSRLYFYAWNSVSFGDAPFSEILYAFIHGIRFDFFSFTVISLPFVLISLFPLNIEKNKFWYFISKFFYSFSIFIILIFNAIDTDYFKFSGKRSTIDFFTIATTGDEMTNMIPQLIVQYWYHVIFVLILTYASIKFFGKKDKSNPRLNIATTFTFLVALTTVFFLIRGFGLRPVSIIDAADNNPHTEELVLNTTFTILQTATQDNIKPVKYFAPHKAKSLYSFLHHYPANKKNNGKNVVIIIFESFGKEYIGFYNPGTKTHTPFLDSLLRKSLTFEYSFANAKKSIEGIPAVLASIPVMYDNPFILSPFASNRINSLATVLKKHGYTTSFFHGGENGTMNFDKFCKLAGFDNYFGMNEYPAEKREKDYDGAWGIYDEPFLQFFANKLKTMKQPFFSALFTLSSHHPFSIPEKYKNRFVDKPGELPVMKTVEYTDMALKKFFETAKRESWFKNTLFVFVADHTSWSQKAKYQTRIGKFSILLSYYSPTDTTLQRISKTITQQIDIFPSVINYLGYTDTIYSPGNSVFSKQDKHISFAYLGSIYHYINNDYICLFDGKKTTAVYNYHTDTLLKQNLIRKFPPNCCDTLKAIIQNYSNDVYYNKMIPEGHAK